jgi:hypothetical protein
MPQSPGHTRRLLSLAGPPLSRPYSPGPVARGLRLGLPARHIPGTLHRTRRGHVSLGPTADTRPKPNTDCGRARAASKPHAMPCTLRARQRLSSQTLSRPDSGGAGASRLNMDLGGPGRLAAKSQRHGKHLGVFASPSPSSKGTQHDQPAQVGGGSTPNQPCCSPFGDHGDAKGFETPEQQHTTSPLSFRSGRERSERTQVRSH